MSISMHPTVAPKTGEQEDSGGGSSTVEVAPSSAPMAMSLIDVPVQDVESDGEDLDDIPVPEEAPPDTPPVAFMKARLSKARNVASAERMLKDYPKFYTTQTGAPKGGTWDATAVESASKWEGWSDQSSFSKVSVLGAICKAGGVDPFAAGHLDPSIWKGWIESDTETAFRYGISGAVEKTTAHHILATLSRTAGWLKGQVKTSSAKELNTLMSTVHSLRVPHSFTEAAASALESASKKDFTTEQRQVLVGLKHGVSVPIATEERGDVVERPWKDHHLGHLDDVLSSVPEEHLGGNTRLTGIIREKTTSKYEDIGHAGGSYEESSKPTDGMVRMWGNSKSMKRSDMRVKTKTGRVDRDQSQLVDKNDQARHVQSIFAWVLRHEIGHAVDNKIGASRAYCKTAAGGSWEELGAAAAAATTIVPSFLAASSHLIFELMNVGKSFDEATAALTEAATDFMANGTPIEDHSALSALSDDAKGTVKSHPTTATLTAIRAGCFKADESTSLGFDGSRSYLKDPANDEWFGFDTAARGRKVSRYQFRSPSEWFAEAYAAFYEPASKLGAKLGAVDPKTRNWMNEAVHDSGAPLEMSAVKSAVARLDQEEQGDDVIEDEV